MTKFV